MPGLRTFPWRFAVYGVVLLYLAGDLYVFRGPLKRRIEVMRGETPSALELAKEEDIVATANGFPIRRGELELAVSEYCFRRGIDEGSLSRERRNAIRVTVRNELITDRLLWHHAQASPVEVPASVLEAVKNDFSSYFRSTEEMETAAAARGFAPGQLDAFLESLAHQQVWVETKIAPHIAVSDEEVLARYRVLGDSLGGASFDEAREEVRATLEAEKRQWAVDGLIDHLGRKAVRRHLAEDFWVE